MSDIHRLLIIGCGNMGSAMLAGWLNAGVDADCFAVLDPGLDQAPFDVAFYSTAGEAKAAGSHDAVLLGFKPQQLASLGPGLQELTSRGVRVYSLLAGITLDQLQQAFPDADAHIRVMPNLAARINKSPIILAQAGLGEEARAATQVLFDKLGTAVWLEDEQKFDLLTALAGSGPGFVYRFIDALAQAAIQLGAEASQATALALAMVDGASTLAARSDVSPGELADRVASPGGMTREGLNILDADDALVDLLTRTLEATANRGAELSSGNS